MTSARDRIAAALPSYEIGEEIGRGAWGFVLAAEHRQLGRPVAIKELSTALASDPSVRRRFVSEARLLAALEHPHIVPIYDYVEDEGVCLLVMELCPQGTVWDRFKTEGIRPDAACAIALATCSALHYAHGKGILHRDIKPENLLFNSSGTLRVTDFGIAKVIGGAATVATQTGEILGTPSYMAPEQATASELSPATDVYGVGTLLYELLSGQLPFRDDGNVLAVLYRHVHEQPTPLAEVAPHLPMAIVDAVMQALVADPGGRYGGADEFGVALADAANASWGPGWVSASGLDVVPSRRVGERISGGRPPVAGQDPASDVARPPLATAPQTLRQRPIPKTQPDTEPGSGPKPTPNLIPIPPPPGFAERTQPVMAQADAEGPPPIGPPPIGPPPIGPPPIDPSTGGVTTRRSRPLIFGSASLVLVVAVVVLIVTRSGGGGPPTAGAVTSSSTVTITTTAAPTSATTPITIAMPGPLVFKDDFTNPQSGWAPDPGQGENGTASYEADGYHVSVLKPLSLNTTFSVASPYRTKLPSIAVQVDASFVTAAPPDGLGVRCDQGGRAGLRYTFQVFNNGHWNILDLSPTHTTILTGGEDPIIHAGGATNTIIGQCSETGAGVTRLVMSVNGKQLASITDNEPPGPYVWHGALTAYRSAPSPATEIRFNNYRLYQPAS